MDLITLAKAAEEDESIVAVTAAMGIGTGLDYFGKKHPERYFDVGIAEEHALTFSAGLAANGMKPFVDIYSTFLQRGYDNIIHDICLQNLPVRIIIDRASLAVSDGATHHGIFDVAFLSHIPGIKILAPMTYGSLRAAVKEAKEADYPLAIRYPNRKESKRVREIFYPDGDFSGFGVRTSFDKANAPEYLYITYGSVAEKVLEAVDILEVRGIKAGIVLLERLKPYDEIAQQIKYYATFSKKVVFVEEGIKNGGAGMLLGAALAELNIDIFSKYEVLAIDDNFASPKELCDIYEFVGMSPSCIAEKILERPLEKTSEKIYNN